MNFRTFIVACAVFTALCALPSGVFAAPASHCGADETIVFTCPVAGQKLLSICSSREYGPERGFMEYRYGPAGKPEMVLPTEKTAPAKAARSGSWMFSGGGGAYVEFLNGTTGYYVYTAIGKWGEAGAVLEKAGVAVQKDGKVLVNIRCVGPETSELGPSFFEELGLAEVEDEFELPE